MGDKRFSSAILASALFAWGCGSPGSEGLPGRVVGRPVRAAPRGAPDPIRRARAAPRRRAPVAPPRRARAAPRRRAPAAPSARWAPAAPRRAPPVRARWGPGEHRRQWRAGGSAGGHCRRGRKRRGGSRRHDGHWRSRRQRHRRLPVPRARAARYGRLGHGRDREPRCDAPDDRGVRLQHRLEQHNAGLGHLLRHRHQPAWPLHRACRDAIERQPVRRAPAEQLQREGHRVALDCARQLQGQQQHAEGRAPAPSCYDSWSTSIANFAKNNKVYAMGAANEPDFASCGSSIGPPCYSDYDTMVFTANEMVAFVKALGPKLKTAGSSSSRPNRRSGSTSGAMLRPRARRSPAIRTARTR